MADLARKVERSLKTLSRNKDSFLKFVEKPSPRPNGRAAKIKMKAEKFQNMRDLFTQTLSDHDDWAQTHELSDEQVLDSHPTLSQDSIDTFEEEMEDAIDICLSKFVELAEANPELEINIPEVQAKKNPTPLNPEPTIVGDKGRADLEDDDDYRSVIAEEDVNAAIDQEQ